MKDIYLPTTRTVSLSLDSRDLRNIDRSFAEGESSVPLGEFMNPEIDAVMAQARANGGKVLYSATSIEQKFESIFLNYFMAGESLPSARRELFQAEILQSSGLSYAHKRELSNKIVVERDLLRGKHRNRLQSLLKKAGIYRNTFAHGRVKHDSKRGCYIESLAKK
jgi:hypothetical protein